MAEEIPFMHSEGTACEDPAGVEDVNDKDLYVDSLETLRMLDFHRIGFDEAIKYQFADLDVAYEFYNSYGKMNGFGVRKHNIRRNKKNEIVSQTFVCCREGMREAKHLVKSNRKKEPKPLTRCDCRAQMRVHIDNEKQCWFVSFLDDNHNHDLLSLKFYGMSRSCRKMEEVDVENIKSMRGAGISTSKIYRFFARQAGGFEKVRFRRKEMYNQIEKMRKKLHGDAEATLEYLDRQAKKDPLMYWKHEQDDLKYVRNIFWMDGRSRVDYEVFGDVLAFDATYGRNKYKCPLVVFSGVNHHLQSVVFSTAFISDESVGTYVWLLERFVEAMNGKHPQSVITDGDPSMKIAIEKVFPQAHHRLCGWHLMRNATRNISKPKFTIEFKKCMLGDFDIVEFEDRWSAMVDRFGVGDSNWVRDMYEKRKMWVAAYMKGKFFAGLRTTSRCEALHSQLGRYIESGFTMLEFVQHYGYWVDYIRNNEVEADFKSTNGFPVMVTNFPSLEKAAAKSFTREVFFIFRDLLKKVGIMKIVDCKETTSTIIFMVTKYRVNDKMWHVSWCPSILELRCSCQRMESFGVPCIHIITVMVRLDMDDLPESLVLPRWSMRARENLPALFNDGTVGRDGCYKSRVVSLNEKCKDLIMVSAIMLEDFYEVTDFVANKIKEILSRSHNTMKESADGKESHPRRGVKDPRKVRTKGCGRTDVGGPKRKRVVHCSICNKTGHNCRNCSEKEKRSLQEALDDDDAYATLDPENIFDDSTCYMLHIFLL